MINSSTLFDNDKAKKSSWLTNSSFKPVNIIEYPSEEVKNEINYDAILESDSDEHLHVVRHKKRKEKKKHHKKIKRRDIMKCFLKDISSIEDEQCKFRKMIFVEEVPRDERIEAFFLDRHGNPYISQYGSICEKHVPKYRSKKKEPLSVAIADRYYMTMKGLTNIKGQSLPAKKKCDSRCTCRQFFIPVPYDIVASSAQESVANDQEIIDEVAAINETLNNDPHNIDAWLSLVTVQSKANQMGVSSTVAMSIVVEKRLMIVERALTKNQSNLQLHLMRMQLGGEVWSTDKLQKEWNQLLIVWNTNIDVWKFYIDQIAKKTLGFSVKKVISIYTKCFSTFFNVMSGRMKTKTIDSETVMDLCDLFADYCEYLNQSGYSERAMASWQAVIEYNLFCGPVAPRQSGNILDDPMLRSLHDYWINCPQHIGQPDSRGWAFPVPGSNGACPLQASLEQFVSARESGLIEGDLNDSEMWHSLEGSRQAAWWLPYCSEDTDQEDEDRLVAFPQVQSCLVTVHDPCNLSEGSMPAADVARRAKQRLALLFLDSMDVCHPRVSIRHNLSPATIRRHQLAQCASLSSYTIGLSVQRQSLSQFVVECLCRLRSVFLGDDGGAWMEDVAVIELCYRVRASLATEAWKEALAGVRRWAKEVLVGAGTGLWLEYGWQLVSLAEHGLFMGQERPMRALVIEVRKVVHGLAAVDSAMTLDQRLATLALDLHLTLLQASDSQGQCQRAAQPALAHATSLLATHHALPPPQTGLASLALLQTELLHRLHTSDHGPASAHWHWTMYCHAATRLLLADTEPFMAWMRSDCVQIITDMGTAANWCPPFCYQLSLFLEQTATFFRWYLRSTGLNECAHLQSVMHPLVQALSQAQDASRLPILDLVLSPRLLQLSVDDRSMAGCQRLGARNFLWSVVSATETETTTAFNLLRHGSSLVLIDMELRRWATVSDGASPEMFSGRAERVRSTFNRLLALRCMHWRHRLALWLAMMRFEDRVNCSERTRTVFYRAVTEMPGQKCLYMTIVGLVPSMLEEVTSLMKSNEVRLCAPLEEVRLLLRIRDSAKAKLVPREECESVIDVID